MRLGAAREVPREFLAKAEAHDAMPEKAEQITLNSLLPFSATVPGYYLSTTVCFKHQCHFETDTRKHSMRKHGEMHGGGYAQASSINWSLSWHARRWVLNPAR